MAGDPFRQDGTDPGFKGGHFGSGPTIEAVALTALAASSTVNVGLPMHRADVSLIITSNSAVDIIPRRVWWPPATTRRSITPNVYVTYIPARRISM